MNDIEKAKKQLYEKRLACVICKGETVYAGTQRGVAFLMDLYRNGIRLGGFSAADKVVGKATAMLMVLMGVETVHAIVMSQPAAETFERHGIPFTYDTIALNIINSTKTGICPMEQAVMEIDDPALAPDAIEHALQRLRETEKAQP